MLTHDMFCNRMRPGEEELASYLPKYWNDIWEMRANNIFAGYTLDRMATDMEQVVKDRFFDTCSENMLARYETFLHITPTEGSSVEDRRRIIKMKWNGAGKMTGSRIRAIVKECCGCDCKVTFGASQLIVDMTFVDNPANYIGVIRNMLSNSTIPAHIEILYKCTQNIPTIVLWKNKGSVETIVIAMEFYIHKKRNYLDGKWCLDGSKYLDSGDGLYPVVLSNGVKLPLTEAFFVTEGYYIKNDIKLHTEEGIVLDSEIVSSHLPAVSLTTNIVVESVEEIVVEITVKKNLHYTDGSVTLDGNTLLNSYMKKEDL